MMEKEHHHVHFGEDADSFGKDNEIVVQSSGEGKVALHLGFLKVSHRYEIEVDLPRDVCGINETAQLRECQLEKVPKVNCKIVKLVSDQSVIHMTIELYAYKEKLLKEELTLECPDTNSTFRINVIARVLGKGKGTPLLRNGIRCIKVEDLDDDSEASDWQGFE